MIGFQDTYVRLRQEVQDRIADPLGGRLLWENDEHPSDSPQKQLLASIQYASVLPKTGLGDEPCYERTGFLTLQAEDSSMGGWRWSSDQRSLVFDAFQGASFGEIDCREVAFSASGPAQQAMHYTGAAQIEFRTCAGGPRPDPIDLELADEWTALDISANAIAVELGTSLGFGVFPPNVEGSPPQELPWLTWRPVEGGDTSPEIGFVGVKVNTIEAATLNVSAFVPGGSGLHQMHEIADAIEARFLEAEIGHLLSAPPTPQPIGLEAGWWRWDFPIPLTATF